ncbi:MAG: hypothetical protein EOO41_00325 [Methanobacteriota archaeon]|nr:MAG: hypothetical protein EOO41_00325 [Euryarchaeota archaeon]
MDLHASPPLTLDLAAVHSAAAMGVSTLDFMATLLHAQLAGRGWCTAGSLLLNLCPALSSDSAGGVDTGDMRVAAARVVLQPAPLPPHTDSSSRAAAKAGFVVTADARIVRCLPWSEDSGAHVHAQQATATATATATAEAEAEAYVLPDLRPVIVHAHKCSTFAHTPTPLPPPHTLHCAQAVLDSAVTSAAATGGARGRRLHVELDVKALAIRAALAAGGHSAGACCTAATALPTTAAVGPAVGQAYGHPERQAQADGHVATVAQARDVARALSRSSSQPSTLAHGTRTLQLGDKAQQWQRHLTSVHNHRCALLGAHADGRLARSGDDEAVTRWCSVQLDERAAVSGAFLMAEQSGHYPLRTAPATYAPDDDLAVDACTAPLPLRTSVPAHMVLRGLLPLRTATRTRASAVLMRLRADVSALYWLAGDTQARRTSVWSISTSCACGEAHCTCVPACAHEAHEAHEAHAGTGGAVQQLMPAWLGLGEHVQCTRTVGEHLLAGEEGSGPRAAGRIMRHSDATAPHPTLACSPAPTFSIVSASHLLTQQRQQHGAAHAQAPPSCATIQQLVSHGHGVRSAAAAAAAAAPQSAAPPFDRTHDCSASDAVHARIQPVNRVCAWLASSLCAPFPRITACGLVWQPSARVLPLIQLLSYLPSAAASRCRQWRSTEEVPLAPPLRHPPRELCAVAHAQAHAHTCSTAAEAEVALVALIVRSSFAAQDVDSSLLQENASLCVRLQRCPIVREHMARAAAALSAAQASSSRHRRADVAALNDRAQPEGAAAEDEAHAGSRRMRGTMRTKLPSTVAAHKAGSAWEAEGGKAGAAVAAPFLVGPLAAAAAGAKRTASSLQACARAGGCAKKPRKATAAAAAAADEAGAASELLEAKRLTAAAELAVAAGTLQQAFSVPQLKAVLQAAGSRVSGTKAELVVRVTALMQARVQQVAA